MDCRPIPQEVFVIVGFRKGMSFDDARQNWDASGPRPLAWSLWYPADEDVQEIKPAGTSWFKQSAVALDARPRLSGGSLHLVLLSHGTGASAAALEWLAHGLAQRGYVVLAVDHHGHTGSEPYRAEGFLCLWERARDLSSLLNDTVWRDILGVPIHHQVSVAGFSAGAYTAMLLIGARVAYSQFEPDNPVQSTIRGPQEFPNLVDELPKLQQSVVFRESWDRRRDDYTDPRIGHAMVIAPGRSVMGFDIESLRSIRKPILMLGGDADTVAPAWEFCTWLHENVSTSSLEVLTGGIGHYTFLPEGTDVGIETAPELFIDGAGLERRAIHKYVAYLAADFFAPSSQC
jgi:predicted dienelactone hydrolase